MTKGLARYHGSGHLHFITSSCYRRQPKLHEFNVWSERKRIEKLRYIHRNPVKRGIVVGLPRGIAGLVEQPEQWRWSRYRAYSYGEEGLVRVNFQEWPVAVKIRPVPVQDFTDGGSTQRPLIRKKRE